MKRMEGVVRVEVVVPDTRDCAYEIVFGVSAESRELTKESTSCRLADWFRGGPMAYQERAGAH